MSADLDRILSEALRLPENDRATIAGKLMESLEEVVDGDEVTPYWAEEIQHRLHELDDGNVRAVPWSEARRQVHESNDESAGD